MSRLLNWLYGLVAILALAYLALPYVSLGRFYFALKSADQAALRDKVDWGSLRQGFRDDLNRFVGDTAETLLGRTTAADKGIKLSLTWKSLPLADEVAAVLATPRGLIALYDHSKAIGCMLAGFAAGSERRSPEQCLERERPPDARIRQFKVQGPNIPRWYQKLHYAFFTDPLTFRLDVVHGDVRVVLVLARRGLGWRVVRLTVPFDHIARRRPDGQAPAGGKG
ncbi:MAG: DUF2939 domain-containing protein [Rhodospirillales bacterium]